MQNTFALQAGAAAFQTLLRDLAAKSDDDLSAAWASDPNSEWSDCRDYKGMSAIVLASTVTNMYHQMPEHREGYLRALTDLLCMVAEGFGPSEDWQPLVTTAQSFAGPAPP